MPVTVCRSERPVNLSGIAPAHAPLDLVTRHSEGAFQSTGYALLPPRSLS